MIEIKNVYKKYGNFTALSDINITIPTGMIFGIVGQSGAGKSTLLRTINKLEEIESGSIFVNGKLINHLSGNELREFRRNTGMIFQHFSLLETKNVYKNIALPLECNHFRKSEIEKRVLELANIVGLDSKLKAKPRELSGGQKQRVAIARALALNPKILLCDEATSALDPITTKQILQLLKKINEDFGITVVIVTHQMEVIKEVCDQIAIMKNAEILEIGNTNELFLSSNQALSSLIDEDEILPATGHNIKLYFSETTAGGPLITKMARDLDIDFSIAWGKLERFKNEVLGSLIINVSTENFKMVKSYLDDKGFRYEVINYD